MSTIRIIEFTRDGARQFRERWAHELRETNSSDGYVTSIKPADDDDGYVARIKRTTYTLTGRERSHKMIPVRVPASWVSDRVVSNRGPSSLRRMLGGA